MIKVSPTLWISENIRAIKLEEDTTTQRLTRVRVYFYDKEYETVFCSTEREARELVERIRVGYDYDQKLDEWQENSLKERSYNEN